MKKFYIFLLAVLITGSAFAQIKSTQISARLEHFGKALPTVSGKGVLATVPYLETFDAGMPASYVIADLDGFPVYAPYTFMTAAWVSTTLSGQTTAAATSTSWYTSAHQSNDWMMTEGIQIPASGTYQIKWKGKASDTAPYNDGYEVYMTSTIAGSAPVTTDFSAAAIFTTAGETNAAWTTHTYVIPASFNGQTIYIAFRNNSTDRNLLSIDDLEVKNNVTILNDIQTTSTYADFTGMSYYEITPLSQVTDVNLVGVVQNNGTLAQTNVTLHADDAINGISGTDLVASQAPAQIDTMVFVATLDDVIAKDYGFKMNATQTATDETPLDNIGDSIYFSTDPAMYARSTDLNALLTSYSFAASGAPAITGMEYGCNYHFLNPDKIDTIFVLIYGANGTGTVTGKLYNQDLTTGARTVVAQSAPYTPNGAPEIAALPLTTFYTIPTVPAVLTATVKLDLNVTTAPRDTIKIGADGMYLGDGSIAGALYLQVSSAWGWYYSSGTVPIVGLVLDQATGINNNLLSKDLFVYPNPVSNTLFVMNKKAISVDIYNLSGQVVASYNNENVIDVTKLAQGSYLVKVVTADKTITEKINIVR